MSIVIGGRAGINSVSFSTNETKVTAYRNKTGEIKINVTSKKKSIFGQIGQKLDKIPFIRGIWMIFEGYLDSWKTILFIFGICLATLFLSSRFITKMPSSIGNKIVHHTFLIWYTYILIILLLVLYSLFIKFSPVGKYHSAEHMVDNAFEKSKNISINNVIKYSRIHHRCGTNLCVFIILFYIIFSLFIKSLILSFLLGCIFGYEVYKINTRWISPFLRPIYIIGYFLQKNLFTTPPDKEHLLVAKAAYECILKIHEANKNGI